MKSKRPYQTGTCIIHQSDHIERMEIQCGDFDLIRDCLENLEVVELCVSGTNRTDNEYIFLVDNLTSFAEAMNVPLVIREGRDNSIGPVSLNRTMSRMMN